MLASPASSQRSWYLTSIAAIAVPPITASGTIIPRLREARLEDQKIHMSWGSFFDFGEGTKQVEAILRQKACTLRTLTASEGHSWGQWRAQLDDILVYFWGP